MMIEESENGVIVMSKWTSGKNENIVVVFYT